MVYVRRIHEKRGVLKANECQLVDKMNVEMLKTNLEKSMEKIKRADAIRKGEAYE